METPLVGTGTPETNPPSPRRPWIVPAISDLGEMKDLTLQTSIPCEGDPDFPVCFP